MRDSLFNPFMPLTSLAGRVVFGGGGGGGGGATAPAPEKTTTTFTSDYPELEGKTYSSEEERDEAERNVDYRKSNDGKLAQFKADVDAAAERTESSPVTAPEKSQSAEAAGNLMNAITGIFANKGGYISGYKEGGDVQITPMPSVEPDRPSNPPGRGGDIPSSFTTNGLRTVQRPQEQEVDDIGKSQLSLQAVQAVAIPTFEGDEEVVKEYTGKAEEYKNKKLETLQGQLSQEQGTRSIEMGSAARNLASKSITDPTSLATKASVSEIDPDAEGTTIAEGTGQLTGLDPQAGVTTVDATTTAGTPQEISAVGYQAATAGEKTKEAMDGVEAAKGEVSDEAKVTAAQGELSFAAKARAAGVDEKYIQEVIAGTRRVRADELAQAAGIGEEAAKAMIAEANLPKEILAETTEVQEEEKAKAAKIEENNMATAEAIVDIGLDADATAVAAKLDKFSIDDGTLAEFKEGKIEAQDTVQGQLAELMKSFDDGTPVWAAGAMRAANAAMAARGLGASSMAGAAIIQAAMESAIPIAAADAEAFRTMKMDNLNRQQQVALTNAAAQQGVELANFNAEQQAALQNSQNAFALQSQNLSNMQQAVIATAQIKASLQGQNLSNEQQTNLAIAARFAEVANMNLSNRQQALLQNNQNELQVNLANLSAKQQAYVVNAQLEAALQGKIIDNKQQTAIANAARFAEANNLTFTAEQQAQLHNSTLMQTIGLQEMSAKNAAILQNAASVASMDMANLSNAQQAAVQNAQAFLQMDMANLTNEQQTAMFKAQAQQQSILSDQAASNAAMQFNASSVNQTNQFMAQLKTQVDQFNAAQKNATEQFNAGQENAAEQFNTQIQNQRDQFNATNALVIAQANAQWRQNAETINNAAQNEANLQVATAANAFTQSTLDQIWQRERDLMDYSFKASETSKERALELVLADKQYEAYADAQASANAAAEETAKWQVWTNLLLS